MRGHAVNISSVDDKGGGVLWGAQLEVSAFSLSDVWNKYPEGAESSEVTLINRTPQQGWTAMG